MACLQFFLIGAVIFLVNLEITTGQTCQGATCVTNAACVNDECTCNAGYTGEGRFLCELTATRCVCVVFGDPHTVPYDTNVRTTQRLPCNYVQSIFATAGGCLVTVQTETVERPGEPFRAFVSRTGITVVLAGVSQTVYLNAAGVASNVSNLVVTDTSTPGEVSIDLPQCMTKALFKPFGATAFSAPKVGSGFLPNICGNCDGVDNDIPAAFTALPSRSETDNAFSLRNLAIQQASTPDGAVCANLRTIVTQPNCASDAQLAKATSVTNGCGALFPYQPFLDCAVAAGVTSTALYSVYRDCLNQYCSGNTAAACTTVAQLYGGLSCTPPPGYNCPGP